MGETTLLVLVSGISLVATGTFRNALTPYTITLTLGAPSTEMGLGKLMHKVGLTPLQLPH